MSSTFFGASFDAANAARVAAFWAAALDRKVAAGADEHDAVVEVGDPGSGPRLAFHQVAEAKSVKNRFHPDLITSDYEGEAERLIALGATRLNELARDGARWTTLADVEGNEFDLIAG
jgi:Glyoxalase-like domain